MAVCYQLRLTKLACSSRDGDCVYFNLYLYLTIDDYHTAICSAAHERCLRAAVALGVQVRPLRLGEKWLVEGGTLQQCGVRCGSQLWLDKERPAQVPAGAQLGQHAFAAGLNRLGLGWTTRQVVVLLRVHWFWWLYCFNCAVVVLM